MIVVTTDVFAAKGSTTMLTNDDPLEGHFCAMLFELCGTIFDQWLDFFIYPFFNNCRMCIFGIILFAFSAVGKLFSGKRISSVGFLP